MKCENCRIEETEENREEIDLRRPGTIQHQETARVVQDMESGFYCYICRSEEQIFTAKEIGKALKEKGLMDSMGNVRASQMPEHEEKTLTELVAEEVEAGKR